LAAISHLGSTAARAPTSSLPLGEYRSRDLIRMALATSRRLAFTFAGTFPS
jgi:hypothetical protein